MNEIEKTNSNNKKRDKMAQFGAVMHIMSHSVFGMIGVELPIEPKEERIVEDIPYEEVYPTQLPPVSMSIRMSEANEWVKINTYCKWLTYIDDTRLNIVFLQLHGRLNLESIKDLVENDKYVEATDVYSNELFNDIGIQYNMKDVFEDEQNSIMRGRNGFDRIISYLEDVHANYLTSLKLLVGREDNVGYSMYSLYNRDIAL